MSWVSGEFRAVDLGDEPLNGQAFCWLYPGGRAKESIPNT